MPFDINATPTGKSTDELESWRQNATERFLSSAQSQYNNTNAAVGGRGMVEGQWLRKISLIVYGSPNALQAGTIPPGTVMKEIPVGQNKTTNDDKHNGLELSQLRVNFRLKKFMKDSPNFLEARIYNLSPETIKKVRQYGRIQLAAGYNSNYGIIFDGTIVLFLVGKENPTDSYLDIKAGDMDEVGNAAIGLTWPANTSWKQRCEDMLKAAAVPKGEINLGSAGDEKSLRSTSFIGTLSQGMRTITNATSSDFWVENGKANVLLWEGYGKGDKVVLSPATGLVNIPKVTPNGIEAQCLLNPRLRLGTLVEIDTNLLSDLPYIPGSGDNVWASTAKGALPGAVALGRDTYTYPAANINPKGTYKILLLDHSGDTRGNPWYSFLVCCAAGDNGELLPGLFPGNAFRRSRASGVAF